MANEARKRSISNEVNRNNAEIAKKVRILQKFNQMHLEWIGI